MHLALMRGNCYYEERAEVQSTKSTDCIPTAKQCLYQIADSRYYAVVTTEQHARTLSIKDTFIDPMLYDNQTVIHCDNIMRCITYRSRGISLICMPDAI